MAPATEPSGSVAFGRFRVLPHRCELLADDRPVRLGDRAVDVLMVLIEARGALVSKDALMTRVWPDRVEREKCTVLTVQALDQLRLGQRAIRPGSTATTRISTSSSASAAISHPDGTIDSEPARRS